MKTKLITAGCVVAITFTSLNSGFAWEDNSSLNVVADAVVVRPACLVATVLGTALFVVSLPFAATSRSVKKTARTLVVKPAKATFTRPLGDIEALQDLAD